MDEQTYALATKAAWYYYMEDNTQAQIAEVMGISRAKVIRLLEEARAQGIVQFSFRKNDSQRVSAEQLLIDRFGLKDAFVVPTPLDSSAINQSIAQSAAHYVSDHLREDGYLNIGYGDTVSRMLGFLAKNREESLNVVSLTGGVSYYLPTVGTTAYSMRLFLTPSPLVVSSRQVRDALLDEKSLQDVSTMTEYADMSVVGIGAAIEGATVLRNGILNEGELTVLKMQGAVGDILNHFIDKDGNLIQTEIEDRVISTDLDKLHQLKNVVGVAGGKDKITAIKAVLNGGYLNVLITDSDTAANLLLS
ncbi:sugar-binding transcriptional regulator [Lancefieldella parvula]|uniref:sugar-binding transcriptional regulator n=1 Tax=Lancefieldella parvula TaxID=1382 RepID=UPI001CAA8EC5|nr:sugar-binding transcriptional regulator [Lancefieldella parvula]MBF0991117.1 sugar-binding transcriptional regulator [Atopobium sp.]MDU4868329.1 sugar-binding transcriptional regulator [Lancefieldella parvula]